MAYSIRYGPHKYGHEKKNSSAPRAYAVTAVFLILFVMGIHVFWPDGAQTLRELILPFSDEQTVEAFQEMVQEVQAGIQVPDAVTAFCREVIGNAAP